eukprot:CAMPEP_0202978990 /NCGR_PEP_ID=MMETSP1396-20130829/85266_1 /ASSEMBLY_ACC=CAM_ASM_000872 /TAXON_ID= /ORGANISM="Pseudokeronopsis sp., Strain Brazil" /LENGTH=183 /DNA_ID=CAMNT_0049718221 /DNA_START=895 /DNA_END=1449 /DNA_ORIENTATION=-
MKEFHAALQLLTQFLYVIRDMASSEGDEKNKKNARFCKVTCSSMILCAFVPLIQAIPGVVPASLLHDRCDGVHAHIPADAGRVLEGEAAHYIDAEEEEGKETEETAEEQFYGEKDNEIDEKAIEKERRQMEEDYDEDYDPNNPNKKAEIYNFIDEEYGDEDGEGFSDESDNEEKYVERTFNFA